MNEIDSVVVAELGFLFFGSLFSERFCLAEISLRILVLRIFLDLSWFFMPCRFAAGHKKTPGLTF